jgi:two-component system, NarL family, response regulator YdfI
MIRVLVSASVAAMRAGLEALLSSSPNLSVVRPTMRGATLAQSVAELHPDVILLDLDWRAADPIAALPPAEGDPDAPALVVLADMPQSAWIADALRTGVHAILPRDATPGEIVAAVQSASLGLITLHPDVAAALAPAIATPARVFTPVQGVPALTPREVEVLEMLAQGLGNKIIARQLGISEHTVKFHISSIFAKLNATSRTEAVTIGARMGLIML